MNERIRLLADEAAKFSAITALPTGESGDKLFVEKFAELIIRECMKESWDEIVSDEDIAQERDPLIREYLKGNNQGIVDVVIKFRNHFGVE